MTIQITFWQGKNYEFFSDALAKAKAVGIDLSDYLRDLHYASFCPHGVEYHTTNDFLVFPEHQIGAKWRCLKGNMLGKGDCSWDITQEQLTVMLDRNENVIQIWHYKPDLTKLVEIAVFWSSLLGDGGTHHSYDD